MKRLKMLLPIIAVTTMGSAMTIPLSSCDNGPTHTLTFIAGDHVQLTGKNKLVVKEGIRWGDIKQEDKPQAKGETDYYDWDQKYVADDGTIITDDTIISSNMNITLNGYMARLDVKFNENCYEGSKIKKVENTPWFVFNEKYPDLVQDIVFIDADTGCTFCGFVPHKDDKTDGYDWYSDFDYIVRDESYIEYEQDGTPFITIDAVAGKYLDESQLEYTELSPGAVQVNKIHPVVTNGVLQPIIIPDVVGDVENLKQVKVVGDGTNSVLCDIGNEITSCVNDTILIPYTVDIIAANSFNFSDSQLYYGKYFHHLVLDTDPYMNNVMEIGEHAFTHGNYTVEDDNGWYIPNIHLPNSLTFGFDGKMENNPFITHVENLYIPDQIGFGDNGFSASTFIKNIRLAWDEPIEKWFHWTDTSFPGATDIDKYAYCSDDVFNALVEKYDFFKSHMAHINM